MRGSTPNTGFSRSTYKGHDTRGQIINMYLNVKKTLTPDNRRQENTKNELHDRYTHNHISARTHAHTHAFLTLIFKTFGNFHNSISKPMPQLRMTILLVSLSMIYRTTMTLWITPIKTERTERPSRDLRVRQN